MKRTPTSSSAKFFHAAILAASLLACSKSGEAKGKATAKPAPAEAKDGKIAIVVTEKGFEPDGIKVKKGVPYTFTFTRKTDSTCATDVILQLGGGKTIEKKLPLNQAVVVEASFADAGDLRYACAMDMIKGVIHVE